MDTSMPSATCGSTPMVTNSVVPIAKPPIASETTASPKWRARTTSPAAGSTARGSVVWDIVTMVLAEAVDDLFREDPGQDASTTLTSDCTRNTCPEVGAHGLPAYVPT